MLSLLHIGPEPLDLERITAVLTESAGDAAGADGAVVTCLGLVRNHNAGRSVRYLEYEAYEPLAIKAFDCIVVCNGNRYIPLKEMNLSKKRYYSRIAGLVDVGLIKRNNGKYFLTLMGKVVYQSEMLIGKTLSY